VQKAFKQAVEKAGFWIDMRVRACK
jgi:hypothetical protein